MEYHYKGHARIGLLFENPNHLGAIAVSLLIILYVWWVQESGRAKAGTVLVWATLSGLSFLAWSTYSRGMLVAFLGTFCLLLLWRPKKWKSNSGLASLFAFAGLLVPEAFQRGLTAASIEDASILNRIQLWKGCLRLLLDVVPSTLSVNDFIFIYHNFYQPTSLGSSNYNTVNTYLSLGLFHGPFAVVLAFGVLAISLTFALSRDTRGRLAIVSFGTIAFGISAIFTDMFSELRLLAYAAVLGLCVIIFAIDRLYTEPKITPFTKTLPLVLFFVPISIGSLAANCWVDQFPAIIVPIENRGARSYWIESRSKKPGGAIFVFAMERMHDFSQLDRSIVRQVFREGCACLLVEGIAPQDLLQALERIQMDSRRRVWIATRRTAPALIRCFSGDGSASKELAKTSLALFDCDFTCLQSSLEIKGYDSGFYKTIAGYPLGSRSISQQEILSLDQYKDRIQIVYLRDQAPLGALLMIAARDQAHAIVRSKSTDGK